MKNGCDDDLVSRIDRLVDGYQILPSVEIAWMFFHVLL
jgi:hypothetical protein